MILSGVAMTAAVAAKQETTPASRRSRSRTRRPSSRRSSRSGGCRRRRTRSARLAQADVDGARLLLEGPQAADPGARGGARHPVARHRRSGQGPRNLPQADGDGRSCLRAPVRRQRDRVRASVSGLGRTCHRGELADGASGGAISTTTSARRGSRRRSPPCPTASISG